MAIFEARELGCSEVSSPTNLEAIHWFFKEGKWRHLSHTQKGEITVLMQEARLIVQEFPSDQSEAVEVKMLVKKAQESFPSSRIEQVQVITSWLGRLV